MPMNSHETEGDLERLLTVADLCRLFQISSRSVYRMVAGGLLPTPIKVGGRNRWPAEQIRRRLRELK